MSLSNAVSTMLIEPRSHSNYITEFKLDDATYDSDLKLVNVGLYETQATGAQGIYYPSINGVLQTIRSITLFSDTVVLDSLQNVAEYSSIEALKCTNQKSEDLNRFDLMNGMGLLPDTESNQSGALSLSSADVDYYHLVDVSAAINNQIIIGNNARNTQNGTVPLRMLLKMLQSTPVLPHLPKLRLVIEWETNREAYFEDPDTIGTLVPSYSVTRPLLVAEQMTQDVGPMDVQIPYLSTIVERFSVPAADAVSHATVPQENSWKSQAFLQKFVKDLTFFNRPVSEFDISGERWLKRSTRSVALKDERLQVVLNNNNHLPDRGITTGALKYHYFNDAQTQLNLPLMSALHASADVSGNAIDEDSAALIGNFSVTSVKVGTVVENLQLELSRLYGDSKPSQEALTLLVFGTVAKNLVRKGDQVRVSY